MALTTVKVPLDISLGEQIILAINKLQNSNFPIYEEGKFLRLRAFLNIFGFVFEYHMLCEVHFTSLNMIPKEVLSQISEDYIIGDIGNDDVQMFFLIKQEALNRTITKDDIKIIFEEWRINPNVELNKLEFVGHEDTMSEYHKELWIDCFYDINGIPI